MLARRTILGLATLALVLLVLGRAFADAPAAHLRWEYFCQPTIYKPWNADDGKKLNAMGAQGWELVQQLVGQNGTNGDVFCFKRPVR